MLGYIYLAFWGWTEIPGWLCNSEKKKCSLDNIAIWLNDWGERIVRQNNFEDEEKADEHNGSICLLREKNLANNLLKASNLFLGI